MSMRPVKASSGFLTKGMNKYLQSSFLFPSLLLIPLLILSSLGINGSSMGVYHSLLNGGAKDPALIANQPQEIRSDEWVVNTQMTIAQDKNGLNRINGNIGNGEDMSVLIDAPYRDWSALFKPHNLGFFLLPLDNAFALKWWLLAYLLIVSCYFFTLCILPRKRLVASLLSVGFFFSPFIQWWYLYGTLGTIFYSLLGATIFVKIFEAKSWLKTCVFGASLAYVMACFVLILYPPFQVPCGLVMLAFAIGYLLQKARVIPRGLMVRKLLVIVLALFIAIGVGLGFLVTRSDTIQTIQNTAYPGDRVVHSGGYDIVHLFAGSLGSQLQVAEKSAHYLIPNGNLTNPSEISSFIPIWLFVLVISTVMLIKDYRNTKRVNQWALILLNGLLLVLMFRMFVPGFDILGKVLMLGGIPHNRLIIAFGLLGFIQIVLFMAYLLVRKPQPSRNVALISASGVFIFGALINLYTAFRFPGYIGSIKALLIAVLVAFIIYLILRLKFVWASLILLAFSVYMTVGVNPLYRGTAILSSNRIIQGIEEASTRDPEKKWVIENGYLENFATMAGAKSLSGVYAYPQKELWKPVDSSGRNESIYNRYAHVSINLDRNDRLVKTEFVSPTFDHFGVRTEPCGAYLKSMNVGFALADLPLNPADSCAKLVEVVHYPAGSFYIYKIN